MNPTQPTPAAMRAAQPSGAAIRATDEIHKRIRAFEWGAGTVNNQAAYDACRRDVALIIDRETAALRASHARTTAALHALLRVPEIRKCAANWAHEELVEARFAISEAEKHSLSALANAEACK